MDPNASNKPETIDIWVVERRLGTGGMGTVYRCHNRHAPKIKAAIKVLANHLQASDTVRRRFIREAELLFELEHPHIVKVRNIRMDATPPFIEMAFVKGVPLSHILKKGPLPPREAARIVAQVASALAHCHARGVRHRDVKPANIIVRDSNATLVDFGVAINVQGTLSQGHRGGSLGTLSYTPPEWGGKGVDPTAWDAYALGIVLFEALVGHMAFPMLEEMGLRESVVQQIDVKRGTPYLDPGGDMPDVLREICRRLTLFDPDQRTTDMGAIADMLTHWLGGELTVLPPTAPSVAPEADPPSEPWAIDEVDRATRTIAVEPTPDPDSPGRGGAGATWMQVTDELEELLRSDTRAGESDDQTVPPRQPDVDAVRPSRGLLAAVVAALVVAAVVGMVAFYPGADEASPESATESAAPVVRLPVPPKRAVVFRLPERGPKVDARVMLGDDRDITDDIRAGQELSLAPGRYTTTVRLGVDCDQAGADCVEARQGHEVAPANDQLVLDVDWPELPPVAVALSPEPPADARARIDDGPWMLASDLRAPWGGPVQIVLQQGECPDEPCGETCAGGCREASDEVVLPLNPDGAVSVVLALPKRQKKKHPPGRGAPVTNAELARWIASNSKWSKAKATALAGTSQGKYLRGWTGNSPPEGQERAPALYVTPEVAEAYCKSEGGSLPDIEAKPAEWPESDAQAEYRMGGNGGVTVLQADGSEMGGRPRYVSAETRIVCTY